MGIGSFLIALVFTLFVYMYRKGKINRRTEFIKSYKFPMAIQRKLGEQYPDLSKKQIKQVLETLKVFFHISSRRKNYSIAMPSQVVDFAWHEFILFTKNYQKFCSSGIGYFLHHTPTEAMTSATQAQESIKNAWNLACVYEGIDPKNPTRIPMLFAIDNELNIENGFIYVKNCNSKSSSTYAAGFCVNHINCSTATSSGISLSDVFESGNSGSGCSSCSSCGGGD